jgi:hypothetical protein
MTDLRSDPRFQTPYKGEQSLAEALGVRIPELAGLQAELAKDRPTDRAGAPWWIGQLDSAEAVLVMDHMLLCAVGVELNLVEAQAHLLELERALQAEAAFLRQPLTFKYHGEPVSLPKHPPFKQTADQIPDLLADIHTVGFFRAVTSAMDCLAGVVIGVLGLPQAILKADLANVMKAEFKNLGPEQQDALSEVKKLTIEGQPEGWLAWVDGIRNMFMHRPRRLNAVSFAPREDYRGIVEPVRQRAVRMAWPTRHLPMEPGLSDMAALIDGPKDLALNEDVLTTLRGVMDSMLKICGAIAISLSAFWVRRRTDPKLVTQPKQVGKMVIERTKFLGYTGKGPYPFDVISTNPSTVDRIVTASKESDKKAKVGKPT